jgi:uncharacterized protein DUF2630
MLRRTLGHLVQGRTRWVHTERCCIPPTPHGRLHRAGSGTGREAGLAYAGRMDDASVQGHIEALVAEEHRLLGAHADGTGLSPDEHRRLEEVRVELDRYWDLLRQRRAREEFGLDPNAVEIRDERTVEGFEQ